MAQPTMTRRLSASITKMLDPEEESFLTSHEANEMPSGEGSLFADTTETDPNKKGLLRGSSNRRLSRRGSSMLSEQQVLKLQQGVPQQSQKEDNLKFDAPSGTFFWTVVGIVAISFWSTAFAGARIAGKVAGAMTSTGACFLFGGTASCFVYASLGKFKKCITHPKSYWVNCGIPFVLYPLGLYTGFHLAKTDTEIIVLTVINYLWPHLMSIFLVVFFNKQWKWMFIIGILGAVCMVFVTTIHPGDSDPLNKMLRSMLDIWPAAVTTFIAALCWAYYSIASSKYAQERKMEKEIAIAKGEVVDNNKDGTLGAVPFLTAISGVVLLIMGIVVDEDHPGPFDVSFYVAAVVNNGKGEKA